MLFLFIFLGRNSFRLELYKLLKKSTNHYKITVSRSVDVTQAEYCGPANIRRYHIKFSIVIVPWRPVFVHPWFILLRAI